MTNIKERVKQACRDRDIPISTLLRESRINSSDFYSVVSGKKPFYPGWRKRIAEALNMSEEELFPEYKDDKGV